jgi:hypothetical protein
MPIHKRDRSFENIVREVEIDKIPVEYIQTLTLILENGDRIIFDGEELSQIDEDNILSFIATVIDELGEEYNSPVQDIEFVINYSRLEKEIISMTDQLLNKKNDNDQGNSST